LLLLPQIPEVVVAAADAVAVAANGKQREGKCLPLLAVFIFHGMLLIIPIVMPHNTHTKSHTHTYTPLQIHRETHIHSLALKRDG